MKISNISLILGGVQHRFFFFFLTYPREAATSPTAPVPAPSSKMCWDLSINSSLCLSKK